jgi:D-aminopeptidase
VKDSLVDVPGVRVGHLTVDDGDVQTGLTVVLPYPLSVRSRKLFIGSYFSGASGEWTGRQVAEDFGTFSSPILLCNTSTVGTAYDAAISFGHARESGLPIDNAWPPIVLTIGDGYLNDLRRRAIHHDQVLQAIESASDSVPDRGSVGIGRGLRALGAKGGVGDASRSFRFDEKDHLVGVLLAASDEGSAVLVATDLPLLPHQLTRLAARAALALTGDLELPGIALALSTGNTIEGAFSEQYQLFPERWPGAEGLAPLLTAASEATRAAFRRALEQATPVEGRKGRRLAPLDRTQLERLFAGD